MVAGWNMDWFYLTGKMYHFGTKKANEKHLQHNMVSNRRDQWKYASCASINVCMRSRFSYESYGGGFSFNRTPELIILLPTDAYLYVCIPSHSSSLRHFISSQTKFLLKSTLVKGWCFDCFSLKWVFRLKYYVRTGKNGSFSKGQTNKLLNKHHW